MMARRRIDSADITRSELSTSSLRSRKSFASLPAPPASRHDGFMLVAMSRRIFARRDLAMFFCAIMLLPRAVFDIIQMMPAPRAPLSALA